MHAKKILLATLFMGCIVVYAQPPAEAVYLQRTKHLDVNLQGSVLKITEHNLTEKLFGQRFENDSQESLFYGDFDPIVAFEAETLPPKGGGKRTKVTTIETKDIVQPGIFYGGYKRKEFVYPNISPGSTGRLSYTKDIKDPHLLTPFYFADDIPVKLARFSVTVPATMVLQFKLFGDSADKIQFHKETVKEKVNYSWTVTDVPAWQPERDAPSRAYTSPHIIVFIDSFERNGVVHKISSGVNDLYNWYSGLIKQIPHQNNDQELKQLVSSLTDGVTSDREKVKVIFQWVQKNIRYVAFEDGMAGFVPRSAMDVYVKRYGDCKDMANILKYMINLSGIKAYHTWIGTRTRPYSYDHVPAAIADNHMICSVKFDDEFIFLDATNPFLIFGNPSSMIQGKEALIGIDDQHFEVARVPVLEKDISKRIDSIYIFSGDKNVTGRVSSELTGYRKDDLEVQSLKASLNQDKEYIRDFFKIGNNDILIEKLMLGGFGDPNKNGRISFDFVQPGYHKKIGNKIYINLAINKTTPGEMIEPKTRRQPIEKEYFYHDLDVTVYDIPEGYAVSYLPENRSGEWPEFGFHSSYEVKGRKIYFTRDIYSSYLYLNKSGFEAWNKFIRDLSDVNNQTVTLSRDLTDEK